MVKEVDMMVKTHEVEVVERFIPPGRKNRPGVKRTPKWIVIHDTANPGADALNHAGYLENQKTEASWHYTVDDRRIVQHLPLDESAYHAGDGARGPGNLYGIGIEICEFKGDDAQARRDLAEDNAAWLVARLLRQYGWGIDQVKQHHDFSPWKKDCPRVLRPRWKKWLDRVQDYLGGQKGATTVAHPVLKRGDLGEAVKRLQETLKRLGHDPGLVDGIFGVKTEMAVRAFQNDAKITVDGIVGPKTWAALEKALKNSAQSPGEKTKYRLLTGTFATREDAEAAAKKLRQQFSWTVYVIASGDRYRLKTGTFSSRQQAEEGAEKLRQMFGWTVYVQEEK